VSINEDQHRQSAKLYDESGQLISSGRVPDSEPVTPTSEGLALSDTFAVQVAFAESFQAE